MILQELFQHGIAKNSTTILVKYISEETKFLTVSGQACILFKITQRSCVLYQRTRRSLRSFAFFIQRTRRSLRSFTFFIKECGVLCVLFGFISHTKMTNLAKKNIKEWCVLCSCSLFFVLRYQYLLDPNSIFCKAFSPFLLSWDVYDILWLHRAPLALKQLIQ